MRLEVRSTIREPIDQIARQAYRMPDQVQRLRYLRGLVTLSPATARWRLWARSRPAVAIGAVAILIGAAFLVWHAI